VDREPVRFLVVQSAGRQLGLERDVQSRLLLLDLWRDEHPGRAVRVALRAGNQGTEPGSDPAPVDQTATRVGRGLRQSPRHRALIDYIYDITCRSSGGLA